MDRLDQLLVIFGTFVVIVVARCLFLRSKGSFFSLLDKAAVAGVVLGVVILIDAFLIEPNLIHTNVVTIEALRLATHAADIKIVHLSDLHVRQTFRLRERLLVQKVNALNPDVIVITGDILEKPAEAATAHALLSELKSALGTYVVLGNTDYRKMKQEQLRQFFKKAGAVPLINDHVPLKFPHGVVWLAGVDDPVHKRDDMKKALEGIPEGAPVILLSHSPEVYAKALLENVDLVLAGHTHGGQIGLPWLVKLSDYANRSPYMKGLFQDGKTFMYVNKGIGTKMFPIRFLCLPEITLLKFAVAG